MERRSDNRLNQISLLNIPECTVNIRIDLLVMTSSNSANKGHQIDTCHSGFTTPIWLL